MKRIKFIVWNEILQVKATKIVGMEQNSNPWENLNSA